MAVAVALYHAPADKRAAGRYGADRRAWDVYGL